MSDLPSGWEWTTLGEIGAYLNGRGFKKSEWSDTGRPIIRIQNLTGSGATFNYYEGEAEERHTVRDGDLLVSWAATLGVYVWRGPEAVLNQHIFKVDSSVHPGFHRWLLEHVLADLQRQTHGSGMVHITKGRFDSTPVPLPPLGEQERIVAAIEEHLSRLDGAEAALRSAERRVRTLDRTILARAQEGGDVRTLGDLLVNIEAGKSFKTPGRSAQLGEWGVIKVSAMTWGEFDESENKAVPPGQSVDPRYEIRPGDLLLSRANTSEYVGATVLIGACRPRLLLSDKSMRLVMKENVERRWLRYALSSPQVRTEMSLLATGTSDSMRNISQAKVRSLHVVVPSPARQVSLADEIEGALLARDRLVGELSRARSRVRALRRSILAAAFAGRLVPQDPDDTPASVLLERIRAERAAVVPTKRTRRAKTS